MQTPNQIQLDYAIEWLQCNEGAIEEYSSCKAVAEWLIWFVEQQNIKKAAKELDLPVKIIRARLVKHRSRPPE